MAYQKLLKRSPAQTDREAHWVPLSDLMTGLMMLFMLVAVMFMIKVEADSNIVKSLKEDAERRARQMKDVAIVYDQMRDNIYRELLKEFQSDLPRWKATLDRDLTIRFEEPDVLFDTGKSNLKPQFGKILDEFFPRYIRILSSKSYRDSIEEIRIEGHTSTVWGAQTGTDTAYFRNMELSQSRTRSALEHVLLLPQVSADKTWLTEKVTANGLSYSRPRKHKDGRENQEASQRVEFRVRTNAEARIGEILKAAAQ